MSRAPSSAPSSAAASGRPSTRSSSISLASGRPTRPRTIRWPNSTVAWPATGVRQPTPSAGQQRALGGDGGLGDRIGQPAHQRQDLVIVGARLQRQRALADGGQHQLGRQALADARREPQPVQPRAGQDSRVDLAVGDLAQPGVDVAAQDLQLEIRAHGQDLTDPAQAGGADPAAGRQVAQRAPDRLTSASRGSARGGMATSANPSGRSGGHVLEAVHREIDLAGQQLLLDLLDPHPLAAELDHRSGLLAVTLGDHDLLFDHQNREQPAELRADVVGLPAGQRAAARADHDAPASLTNPTLSSAGWPPARPPRGCRPLPPAPPRWRPRPTRPPSDRRAAARR